MFNPEAQTPRREFLKRGLAVAGAALVLDVYKPDTTHAAEWVNSSPSLWPSSFTKHWFPFHSQQSQKWNIPAMDQYAQLYDELDPGKNVLATYSAWADFVRQRNNLSDGYCSHAAAARIVFPKPSEETTYYGNKAIDSTAKMALLTMAATAMIPLGYNPGEAIYARNNVFLDGTATKSFVVNRPKPGEDGGWFVVVDGVTTDGVLMRSDDFNLGPYNFSPRLVKDLYEPYLPDGSNMSADVRSQYDYWRLRLQSWILPVDLNKIMSIVYGTPVGINLARVNEPVANLSGEKKQNSRLMTMALNTRYAKLTSEEFLAGLNPVSGPISPDYSLV